MERLADSESARERERRKWRSGRKQQRSFLKDRVFAGKISSSRKKVTMKLSGTTALYAQLKELQTAVSVTEKQIAMAEELEAPKPEKPEKKTRRKRTPKVNGSEALIEGAAKRIMGPDLREEL